jgi:hypothetical protein
VKLISVLNIRRSRIFLSVFSCLLLLAVVASAFDTFFNKQTSRAAMISLNASGSASQFGIDPFQTEFRIIESEAVLAEAAWNLNLNAKWGVKYNHGTPLDIQDTIARIRRALTLRRYNSILLEIRVRGDNPEEAARIANAVAAADYKFHQRASQAYDFVAVQIASTAASDTKSTEPNLFLRLAVEIILGAVFSLALALGTVGIIRAIPWAFGIKDPAWPGFTFKNDFAGKIVGALWVGISAILAILNFVPLLSFDRLREPIGAVHFGKLGAFWGFNCLAGFFLMRSKSWAKIYLILAAGYTALPLSMSGGTWLLSPFRWDFALFGIGTICALLIPQGVTGASPEPTNASIPIS